MLGRATQNGWIVVKSSDKTWAAGGGNGNPLQYSLPDDGNLMNPTVKIIGIVQY